MVMVNIKKYPMYLWIIIIILTISSCNESNNIYEKKDINIENVFTPASTKVEKSVTESITSTQMPQKEKTIIPTISTTSTQAPSITPIISVTSTQVPSITPTFPAYPIAWSADGMHVWFWSQENPLDDLNLRIQDGYTEILNIVYGDNVWMATLLRHDGYSDSIHFYKNLDREQIEELMLGGNKVKIICPGDGGWLVVTTKDNNYLNQKVILSSEFNLDEINKFIKEGYWVTELRYWENQWVVVLTETDDIMNQKFEMVTDIGPNRSHIDLLNKDLYTSIVYDGQQWFVVRSELAEYRKQSLVIYDFFHKDILKGEWNQGYFNTKIYYGNDQWIYVFTK